MQHIYEHPWFTTLWLTMICVTACWVSMVFSKPFNRDPFEKQEPFDPHA